MYDNLLLGKEAGAMDRLGLSAEERRELGQALSAAPRFAPSQQLLPRLLDIPDAESQTAQL
jgi:hypothetical protein